MGICDDSYASNHIPPLLVPDAYMEREILSSRGTNISRVVISTSAFDYSAKPGQVKVSKYWPLELLIV
jgi:hypothetical protein